MQVNPSNFEGTTPGRAVLLELQATIRPATGYVPPRSSSGNPDLVFHLADPTPVHTVAQRLLPGCPVISEATDVFGALWPRALQQPLTVDFLGRIDAMFLE